MLAADVLLQRLVMAGRSGQIDGVVSQNGRIFREHNLRPAGMTARRLVLQRGKNLPMGLPCNRDASISPHIPLPLH
jgi:hypothetical protein